MLTSEAKTAMNGMHSMLTSVVTGGTIYGWRLDAMLISGMVWILLATCEHLRRSATGRSLAVAHRV